MQLVDGRWQNDGGIHRADFRQALRLNLRDKWSDQSAISRTLLVCFVLFRVISWIVSLQTNWTVHEETLNNTKKVAVVIGHRHAYLNRRKFFD